MVFLDFFENSAYPTPFAYNPLLPLVLWILSFQKSAPDYKKKFKNEYDFIIVGAGSAGSVVASRLSELPCVSVLLLEAGKSPPAITEIPALSRNLWFTDLDWQFKTVPQKHCGDALVKNQVIWPSGKAIGGSSIINAMLYVRGNKKNYDDWAEGGAEGWSYKDVFKYFMKLEDNNNEEFVKNGFHNTSGPISVERATYKSEIMDPIVEAGKALGYPFLDSNGASQTGFYDFQGSIRKGQRCSAAKGYLVPAEKRPNLDIVPNAFVRKVIIENGRATGVSFEHGGKAHEVKAKKEVIMSAGTTNSAQLLMLSGIGPKKHLDEMGITVAADLPVGENFQDHCGAPVGYEMDPKKVTPIEQKAMNPLNVLEYLWKRTGLLSSNEGISAMGFLSSDPTSTVDFPKFEIYFIEVPKDIVKNQLGLKPEVYDKSFKPFEKKPVYYCVSQLVQPKSRGTVRLNSTDPHDPPLIDPNYFDPSTTDLQDVVDGLKVCQKIGTSEAMKKVGSKPFPFDLPGCESFANDEDKYFECAAKAIVLTFSHQVGTAKMGKPGDPTTVVDTQLKVIGVEGLRVVDASVMPIVPSGNTNIPTMMVAEKAADIIKETLNCPT